jgi:hypothetical protein
MRILKDRLDRTIGHIDTRPDGSQIAYDSRYRKKGSYDPRTNTTYDERYRKYGKGYLLDSLIVSAQETSATPQIALQKQTAGGSASRHGAHRKVGSYAKDNGTAIVVLVLFAFLFLIISPGLVFNLAVERFREHPDGLFWASVRDIPTWLFSTFTWGCIILFGFIMKRPRFLMGRFLCLCLAIAISALLFYAYVNYATPAKAVAQTQFPPNSRSNPISQVSAMETPPTDSNTGTSAIPFNAADPSSEQTEITDALDQQESTRPLTLTFPAQHKHSFGSCFGTLILTPDQLRFESNSHQLTVLMNQIQLHKDGVQDPTGKRWHFIIQGQSAPLLLKKWKDHALFQTD